jgi:hypothetical protein
MSKLKNDNSLKSAEEVQIEIYSKMSFAQKWERVWDLRKIAWNLKAVRLRSQNPDWTESQVQNEVRKIFLYGST